MEQLLEMLLAGGIRLPLTGGLLALDREMPKSDFLALLILQRRGEASMSELAADLGVPLSTATGIGARLVKRKLVQREQHPRDRRVSTLRLTPAGHEMAARVRDQIAGIFARIQQALTPDELQQLTRLVGKVLQALQAPPSDRPEGAQPSTARRIPIE